MFTTLRRMFWMALFAGAGYAGWTTWQRRSDDTSDAAPEWPPLDPWPAPVSADAVAAAVPSAGPPPAATAPRFAGRPEGERRGSAGSTSAVWVEPVDGDCPSGYPIKANDNSGIFHVPGGRFYERTVPERCYADAHDAEADGYRRAKA